MPKSQLPPALQGDMDRLRSSTPLAADGAPTSSQKVRAGLFAWVCFLIPPRAPPRAEPHKQAPGSPSPSHQLSLTIEAQQHLRGMGGQDPTP